MQAGYYICRRFKSLYRIQGDAFEMWDGMKWIPVPPWAQASIAADIDSTCVLRAIEEMIGRFGISFVMRV